MFWRGIQWWCIMVNVGSVKLNNVKQSNVEPDMKLSNLKLTSVKVNVKPSIWKLNIHQILKYVTRTWLSHCNQGHRTIKGTHCPWPRQLASSNKIVYLSIYVNKMNYDLILKLIWELNYLCWQCLIKNSNGYS